MALSAFPDGEDGIVEVKLKGLAANGSASTVVDTWTAPYKCRLVRCVTDSVKLGGESVDDVRLEATGSLTLVEFGAIDADEDSTLESLEDDAVENNIDAGDVLTLLADTAAGSEKIDLMSVTLGVKPL